MERPCLRVEGALVVDLLTDEGGHHQALAGVDEAEERRRHDAVVEVAGLEVAAEGVRHRVRVRLDGVVVALELDLGRQLGRAEVELRAEAENAIAPPALTLQAGE